MPVDPQAGEDLRSVGHDQHRMVAEKRVAHPQAVEPNQVDGDDMALEIADFLGFHGLGTQFAAQRFADAGADAPVSKINRRGPAGVPSTTTYLPCSTV